MLSSRYKYMEATFIQLYTHQAQTLKNVIRKNQEIEKIQSKASYKEKREEQKIIKYFTTKCEKTIQKSC